MKRINKLKKIVILLLIVTTLSGFKFDDGELGLSAKAEDYVLMTDKKLMKKN